MNQRSIRRHLRWLVPALVFLACIVCPDESFGRAGGGGGYSGGGGGGFSGGGSFGGGSFHYGGGGGGSEVPPWMAIVIILGFIVFNIVANSRRNSETSAGGEDYGAGERRIDPDEQRRAVAELRRMDPAFDPIHFGERFKSAFLQIQGAWSGQQLEPVRRFVSDGIFERFTLQIAEQRALGYRDHMEQIRITRVVIAAFATTHLFDVLTVQVAASAFDYRESLATGKYLSGERSRQSFVEYWSFIRRSGVQSGVATSGLIEGNCPNCGAGIQLNQHGGCASCGALLRSGDYDWVLAEITQSCEWRPRSAAENRTARTYRETKDPGFSIQHLEDRSSVVFWRLATADRLGDVKPILKMATHDFCTSYWSGFGGGAEKDREYFGNCSVGSVELLGIASENEFDYAMVEIRWSAHRHLVSAGGHVIDLGQWSRYRSVHVLARRAGVATNVARAIQSAHCPSCGAPESDLASNACEHCGVVLNTGDHDWTLVDKCLLNSAKAEAWIAKLKSASQGGDLLDTAALGPSPTDALAWMVKVLAADGEIHPEERAAVLQFAGKAGVAGPEAMVDGLIQVAIRGELDAPRPPDAAAGRAWLELMADVALADGVVKPAEAEALAELGSSLGYVRADMMILMNKRRVRRFQRETYPELG
jgi:uncharacterized tellurite resistance protein B-like protein